MALITISLVQQLGQRLSSTLLTTASPSRTICLTRPMLAEPPKKRRRIDPAVMKVRVERKIRKLEREINKIERQPKQPIPLAEYNLQPAQIRELNSDALNRNISETDLQRIENEFKAACKLWSVYRHNQAKIEQRSIVLMKYSQDRALKELKKLSPELYDKAVADDECHIIPSYNLHLVKDTPPDSGYTPPDGYIKDVTKEWSM